MIPHIPAASALSPARKADLIFNAAQAELSSRLWNAALGQSGTAGAAESDGEDAPKTGASASGGVGLSHMLALLDLDPAVLDDRTVDTAPRREAATERAATQGGDATAPGLGANARYLPLLASAATRTGVPAAALASIIDAEAAKAGDGEWRAFSRNPRSSAAGLGQFLARTWEGIATTSGTWLNGVAQAKGWIDSAGHIAAAARPALLALRYEPGAAIQTIADHARHTLDRLAQAGFDAGNDVGQVARLSYLGHHLGVSDAVRFLRDGALPTARAQHLLTAQVGAQQSASRVATTGDASSAHRSWLLAYLDRHVRPERFSA